MAESNPTQVILTDDGLKIINAQTTADNAASEVTNLNDSSKLGPAEKQALSRKYQADKALYSIDIKMLTDVGLPTTNLQSAMTALDSFITPYFQDMGKTEQVSRDRLNQVFTGFDTADKNANSAFNDMVSNAANDAKKAGDDAKEVGEQAQEVGEAAKQAANQAQADATQAKADATTAQQKAQSSIDQLNAHLPDIDEALSTANLVKQNVTKLSDTTEQYHNEYTTGIQNVVKTIDDASTEIDQLNNAIKLKADSTDVTSQINVAVQGIQTDVTNKVSGLSTKINQTASAVQILSTNAVTQSDITASINNIHMGIKGADGSTSTFNMNNNTILLDANKIIINGNTSIQNGTIGTAKIANAAINTAQIADGAINNAKIANAAINDAKIANLNGNKIIAGSITSQQLNADDIIANVINGKTINGITINTPNLNLGTNGVLNEDWNLNQNTGWFQPKKVRELLLWTRAF